MTGGDDSLARVWALGLGGHLRLARAPLGGFTDFVYSLCSAPAGPSWRPGMPTARYASGAPAPGHRSRRASVDAPVYLWDVADPAHPRLLSTLSGFDNYAFSAAFSPDGKLLAAGSADHTVRLWDISDPARPRAFGGPLVGPTSYVYQVAIGPDGKTLAGAATTSGVWLWDISDPAHPTLLANLHAATGNVFSVSFSPHGQVLVASGSNRTSHFWDYEPGAATARVCAVAGTPLTRAEWAQYVQGRPYDPPCD